MEQEGTWEEGCVLAAKIWSIEEIKAHIRTFKHVLQQERA